MSLININVNTNEKMFEYKGFSQQWKSQYGEIHTPFSFIREMLSIIPEKYFKNKNLSWLDVGAGQGNFSVVLFFILYESLRTSIPNNQARINHIIENMITMIEVNPVNYKILREKFGEKANIINIDYLTWKTTNTYDFVIGNPPYNADGLKKVPSKTNISKKKDGKTIWYKFVKKNISLLKPNGFMNILIPSIWMKPDKEKIYYFLLNYKIHKLCTLNANTMNKTFDYHVQTPTTYFLLEKKENDQKILLYDELKKDYFSFSLTPNIPIPLCFSSIVGKCLKQVSKYGFLQVIKTNMPPKKVHFVDHFDDKYCYSYIKTTTLNKNKEPVLQLKYSNKKCMFLGEPKIVMAHKMYGFPFLDKTGKYGIYSRDNYIIKDYSPLELEMIAKFLSHIFFLFLFETTRYRMRYLEKYVFLYIADIVKVENIQEKIQNPDFIYDFFEITKEEKIYIENYFKTKYKFFKI